ncbi:MAG: hypothetical protein GDA55_03775 [Cellvibrionales bacterium]|nr:hypothetical protein [Cellvibrionales bacterium]
MRYFIVLAIFFTCTVQAQANDDAVTPENSTTQENAATGGENSQIDSPPPAPQPAPATPTADRPANKKPPARQRASDPDFSVFRPSEELAEDLAVPFPTDI